jgi:toxin ParE1/3/4
MTLIWAEGAIADLVQIRAHIGQHNPQAARHLAERLLAIAKHLPTHPQMGIATIRPNVRRLVVPQTVYSLIYRVTNQDIEIIEVFDGRRRRPRSDI